MNTEENPDYDIFAAVRPKRRLEENQPEDVAEQEEVDEFADVRPNPEKIAQSKVDKNGPEKKHSPSEIAKDVAQQTAKGVLIGAGGTWGNLAELAGAPPPKQSKGARARNQLEFDVLEKMEQPGYKPSYNDLMALNSEDVAAPGGFGLPTSEQLRDVNEIIGGPGEAKTGAGRYAGRSAELYGAGLAFGQLNPVPAIAAGAAGQTVEEVGLGPLWQTGAEIATLLATGGKGKSLTDARDPKVKRLINQLRREGYTEEEITLAINRGSEGRVGGIKASKGEKTKQTFEDFSERSNDIVGDILTQEIPGIEHGIQHVHQMASDAYGHVVQEARNLSIKNAKSFVDSAKTVVKEATQTLGKNPNAAPFIKRLNDASKSAIKNPTADHFINFYQELNGLGDWMGRSQKDRLINMVKDGIYDTFAAEGPKGKELAESFEKVNKGIRKAYQAQDAYELIQKANTQDGYDFKKLSKLFDKPENVQLLEDVLGKTEASNLKLISKTAKEVKDFDKSWKAISQYRGNQVFDAVRGFSAGYYFWKGDMAGLAGLLASKGFGVGGRKVAEELLTNPKFQNLYIKGLHAISRESPKAFYSANEAMQKYLKDDEGIDINLD